MTKGHKIRSIAALLLLICFVLPLSRCTKQTIEVDPDGKVVASKKVQGEYSYLVPITEIEFADPHSFIYLLPFIWPIPLWQLMRRVKNEKLKLCFLFFEAALLCVSTYYLVIWTFYYGSPYWGGVLAVICLATLWVVFLLVVLGRIKMIMNKRI
jgi:hypothetical protein